MVEMLKTSGRNNWGNFFKTASWSPQQRETLAEHNVPRQGLQLKTNSNRLEIPSSNQGLIDILQELTREAEGVS